jgi:predicted nucleic acid-binding Zn ribbon protein
VSDEGVDPGGAAGGTGAAGVGTGAGDGGAAASGGDLGQAAFAAARRTASRRDPGSGGSRRRRRPSAAGARGGYSGSGPDERDPQELGALVRGMVADRGWDGTVASAVVVARWEHLVGREIASRCRPTSLVDGELVLTAESTAWATQLRLLAPRLLGRIAAELGPGVVSQIRVHGPTAPTWRKGPLRFAGRGPRDTYG